MYDKAAGVKQVILTCIQAQVQVASTVSEYTSEINQTYAENQTFFMLIFIWIETSFPTILSCLLFLIQMALSWCACSLRVPIKQRKQNIVFVF